jgi:hypothetical protein
MIRAVYDQSYSNLLLGNPYHNSLEVTRKLIKHLNKQFGSKPKAPFHSFKSFATGYLYGMLGTCMIFFIT